MTDHIVEVEPVENDAELHTFLTRLQDHVAVPVRDEDGAVDEVIVLDHFAQRSFPIETRAGTVAEPVTTVHVDDDLATIVRALLDGPYRAVPILDDGYVGLVTERSVLQPSLLADLDQRAEEVMNPPITIDPDATIGRARSVMRKEDIGRLPVVEKDRLVGVLEWSSILELSRPKDGQTRGHIDKRGEVTQDDKISVQALVEGGAHTVGRDTPVREVAASMRDREVSYAVVVDQGKLVGIMTAQDILELVVTRVATGEGVWIQVSGAQELEDLDHARIIKHVESQVEKIARIHGGSEFFYLHIKRYHTDGTRTKWSIRTRMMTPVGAFFSKGHGYELLDVVDDTLDRLERQIIDDHEKAVDRSQRPGS